MLPFYDRTKHLIVCCHKCFFFLPLFVSLESLSPVNQQGAVRVRRLACSEISLSLTKKAREIVRHKYNFAYYVTALAQLYALYSDWARSFNLSTQIISELYHKSHLEQNSWLYKRSWTWGKFISTTWNSHSLTLLMCNWVSRDLQTDLRFHSLIFLLTS